MSSESNAEWRATMAVTQLGYLGVEVQDLEAWRRFASDTLGLEVLSEKGADGSLLLRMDERHHRFFVSPGERDDVSLLGFELASQIELDALATRLEEAGTTLTWGNQTDFEERRVVNLFRFEDPSGIACEAYTGPLVMRDQPFRSPRAIDGFYTGDQGLGHIVLAVKSLDESMRFYTEALGFRMTDWVRPQPERGAGSAMNIAFFHCNPRHHSVAMVEVPGAPKRLHHFMLQVQSLDDVGSTYDQCADQGVPIELTLGRHTNDEMFSFYMGSPSGFWVEYGYGAREVDDATWKVELHTTGSSWGHKRPA